MADAAWILVLACPDRVGIVAEVAGALAARDGFILDSQQHADLETSRFFLRIVFAARGPDFPSDRPGVEAMLAPLTAMADADWRVARGDDRPGMVIAVSRSTHCLNDLLHRWRTGALNADVRAVASDHDTGRALADHAGAPFHALPPDPEGREAALASLMEATRSDQLVLARFMRILSPGFVDRHAGRIINIHHSFLPGFKGARPYERAHARGVKLIGATAHFVTADLDEGPIIEQDVERVDHRASPADLARIGRDFEMRVLARAVGWVAERRVLRNGERTVVFR